MVLAALKFLDRCITNLRLFAVEKKKKHLSVLFRFKSEMFYFAFSICYIKSSVDEYLIENCIMSSFEMVMIVSKNIILFTDIFFLFISLTLIFEKTIMPSLHSYHKD